MVNEKERKLNRNSQLDIKLYFMVTLSIPLIQDAV